MKPGTLKKYQQEVLQYVYTIAGNVPAHRNASKQLYSFSKERFEEQLAVWDHLWRSTENFWVRVHAFFFFGKEYKKYCYTQANVAGCNKVAGPG